MVLPQQKHEAHPLPPTPMGVHPVPGAQAPWAAGTRQMGQGGETNTPKSGETGNLRKLFLKCKYGFAVTFIIAKAKKLQSLRGERCSL